jgi:type VI secretion system ImpM family protein
MAGAAGWYGKLPSLGDFAMRRLPADLVEPWDAWLAAGLGQWRASSDPESAWLEAYGAGPVLRFVLAPGVLPAPAPAPERHERTMHPVKSGMAVLSSGLAGLAGLGGMAAGAIKRVVPGAAAPSNAALATSAETSAAAAPTALAATAHAATSRAAAAATPAPAASAERAWSGILLPSVDRVGRHFPLTLLQPWPAAAGPSDAVQQLHWLHHAGELAAAALHEGWSAEELDDTLQQLAEATVTPAAPSQAHDELLRLVAASANAAARGHVLWWHPLPEGGIELQRSHGLPGGTLFARLLSGLPMNQDPS